jgi:hypothetical protein
MSNDHETLPIARPLGMSGNAKHREKRQAGTALPKRMRQDNR